MKELKRRLKLANSKIKQLRAVNRELRLMLEVETEQEQDDAAPADPEAELARLEKEIRWQKGVIDHLHAALANAAEGRRQLMKERKVLLRDLHKQNELLADLKAQLEATQKAKRHYEEMVARLRSMLRNNTRNSLKPAFTDQKSAAPAVQPQKAPDKPANTYNSRQKTGRKRGGQKGHDGKTLDKDAIEELCRRDDIHCGVVATAVGGKTPKFVVDIEVAVTVSEKRGAAVGAMAAETQRTNVVYGPNIKAIAVYLYAEAHMSVKKIVDFFAAITDDALRMSTGTVYNFLFAFDRNAAASISDLEASILPSSVVYTDSTNVVMNGRQTGLYPQSQYARYSCVLRDTEQKSPGAQRHLPAGSVSGHACPRS